MHKPILITGASSGIGEAASVYLAHRGFKVFASARDPKKLDGISGLGEGRITPLKMDVTDEASIAEALEVIASSGATIYGVVNNAAVAVTGPMEFLSTEDLRHQFETNVFGVMNVTRAVLPQMRSAGAGRIVNIGSMSGRLAAPFMGAYGSSKHAVEGLSDSLRRELRPFGVKVSVIRPGFINTSFGEMEQEGFKQFMAEGAPYADQLHAFALWHAKGHPNGASPNVVAEKIYDALTARRPHSRYTAPSKLIITLMMRNLLPSALTDRIIERATGLDHF